jgi:hypothetical protein
MGEKKMKKVKTSLIIIPAIIFVVCNASIKRRPVPTPTPRASASSWWIVALPVSP